MDFNLTTEQQQIRKGSLPRISRCLLARSGRAAASRATIATERVLHAHRLALRGIAFGSPAAACVFAFSLTGCASPAARSPQDTIAAAKPSQAAKPGFAEGGPDAEEYGAGHGYPIGDRATFNRIPFLVGSHSHLDQIFEGRLVRRSTTPSPLARAASEPAVRYEYQGQTFTLDDYLARNPATGLLVARGDTILIERYQYGRNDRQRITSWSMAKTVTSILVGIAIAEGHIHSVIIPPLPTCPHSPTPSTGRTSLRHLLQMSSGVRFIEEYSGTDLNADALSPSRDISDSSRKPIQGDITRLFKKQCGRQGRAASVR